MEGLEYHVFPAPVGAAAPKRGLCSGTGSGVFPGAGAVAAGLWAVCPVVLLPDRAVCQDPGGDPLGKAMARPSREAGGAFAQ